MSPAKAPILVVEFDDATAAFLTDQLGADGYEVQLGRTARHAVALASQRPPGLVLLGDLEAPRDSLALLERIRHGGEPARWPVDLPVLVLTARRSELDLLRAFEIGADDVIPKPFSYAEVRARIRAIMRRSCLLRSPVVIALDGLCLDTAARSVTVDGSPVALCRREYELLSHLAGDPSRVFTKRELLADVWGFRAEGSTRTLDTHACRLRRKLGTTGRQFVINLWGVGYCLRRPEAGPGRVRRPSMLSRGQAL